MQLQIQRFRTLNPRAPQALQIPHLLLRPHLDHLPRIVFRVLTEPAIARDIPVPVLEDKDTCLVDFDGDLRVRGVGGGGVVDVGFFARGDAAVDFVEEAAVDEFEEDHAGAGVEDLF